VKTIEKYKLLQLLQLFRASMLRNRCKTAFIVGGFIYQLNDVTVRGEQSLEAALMAGLASPAALPPQHQNA